MSRSEQLLPATEPAEPPTTGRARAAGCCRAAAQTGGELHVRFANWQKLFQG